jgi:exopolysaccharide biosynthesis polyprenyl glycosylphosphotransferase
VFLLQRVSLKNLLVAACFALVWQELFVVFGLYDAARRLSVREEVLRVVAACGVGCLTLFALPLVSTNPWFRAWHIVAVWLLSATTTLFARQLLRLGASTPASGPVQRVIIVGTGPRAVRVYEELCMHQPFRYVLVGFVDRPADVSSQFVRRRLLGSVEELDRILIEYAVDEVLVALPIKSCYAMIQQTIDVCERAGVQANYLADVFRTSLAKPRYDESHNTPVVSMRVVTDDRRMVVKRAIDIVGATVGLVVCAPLLLLIALAIKLTSPGPAFYTQVRHGLRRRRFRLFKFRTMVTNAEAMQPMLESRNEAAGPVFKIRQDPRTTKIGRLLRRLSLDELPQLVNVLRGDMSLVGPRPLPTRDLAHFGEAWLIRRFSVPQGLTGLWQVSGRSDLDFGDWMTLDLQYIDHWSLTLDARILLRTIPAIVSGRGAS